MQIYKGLTEQEVLERTQSGDVNDVRIRPLKTKYEIVLSHTITYFNMLNLFLAVIIFLTGEWKNATFLGVVFFNSFTGIFQEFRVKKLIDQLTVLTDSKAKVIRDNSTKEIDISHIVRDDLLYFEQGCQICCDCEVVEASGMEVNESLLTGESRPVMKKVGDTLLSGSFLSSGSGIGKVIHVGKENYAIALTMKAKTKKRASSEMQNTIQHIIKIISILIIPAGLLLFSSQYYFGELDLNQSLINTVAGIIGMIPEGLVLLTGISFVIGVGRLAKKKALVQEMEAIEALARVDVLCLDKTGTITTGDITVDKLIPAHGISIKVLTEVLNEVSYAFDDINATQTALMNYFTNGKKWNVTERIPFSSERKYRAVHFENHGNYVLGAPEFLLNPADEVYQIAQEYASDGRRVLLLATCESMSLKTGEVFGINAIGLITLTDVIRPEVKDTFHYFKENNVQIKIISGDNPATVAQIAKKAGVSETGSYVDATLLPENLAEMAEMIEQYSVFGRVTPEQKQKIVKAYQQRQHVVGMVGDGVNDVLAIKDADCGIAMAAGSEAARQAAHIVLMDSDFSSMPEIVREGRMIIANIERVSALYLTKTIYSFLLCIIFIFLSKPYPFIPIQLTLISATTIGIPSFLLTFEKHEGVSKSGFLPHVMQNSMPAALMMVFAICSIQILAYFHHFSDSMISTYTLLVGGTIGLNVLYRVCIPLNKLRFSLVCIMTTIFIICVIFLKNIFNIESIFQWKCIWVIPILILSSAGAQWCSSRIKRRYERQAKRHHVIIS